MRLERLYAIKRGAAVQLRIEENGTNTALKAALRDVLELCEYIDTLRDGIKGAVGYLSDPTGDTHVDDMRAASAHLIAAAEHRRG